MAMSGFSCALLPELAHGLLGETFKTTNGFNSLLCIGDKYQGDNLIINGETRTKKHVAFSGYQINVESFEL